MPWVSGKGPCAEARGGGGAPSVVLWGRPTFIPPAFPALFSPDSQEWLLLASAGCDACCVPFWERGIARAVGLICVPCLVTSRPHTLWGGGAAPEKRYGNFNHYQMSQSLCCLDMSSINRAIGFMSCLRGFPGWNTWVAMPRSCLRDHMGLPGRALQRLLPLS